MNISRNSLSVILRRQASSAAFQVVSLVFSRGALRHRMTLAQPTPPAELLQPELETVVARCIATLPAIRAVVTDPTFVKAMPGLVVARLRVMSLSDSDGMHQVVISFRDVVGAFQNALLPGFGFEAAAQCHRDTIETMLLGDVAQPILDALYALDQAPPDAVPHAALTARLDKLRETRDELCFYLELLKRYVASGPARRAAPVPPMTRPALPPSEGRSLSATL